MSLDSPLVQEDNLFIGEDRDLIYTVLSAGLTTPIDITGWTLEWVLRTSAAAVAATLTFSTGGSGIVLTSPTLGICTVTIPRASTQTLSARTYYYTLRRKDSGNSVVLAFGNFVVQQPSTR